MCRAVNRVVIFLLSLHCLSVFAVAQISRIEPAEPRWGQAFTVVYDPGARGAKLSVEDEVFATARWTSPGRSVTTWARMTRQGGVFRAELTARENQSGVAVHFVTLQGGWDDGAYVTAALFRPDGKPARGVFQEKIKSEKYREYFEKEIALYPDNYSAYRAKWATATLLEGGGAANLIRGDLNRLGRERAESGELLAALATANVMLGREEKSREWIRKAVEKFPEDLFTGEAIREYRKWIGELGLPTDGLAEIRTLERRLIVRNPRTEFARAAAVALAEDRNAPLDLIEAVSAAWREEEPENPQPWFSLALALQNQYQPPERAVPLIEKAIELLRGGRLRLYGDVNSRQTERLLYTAYLSKAELASRQAKNEAALAALATARQLAPEKDARAHLLEARILRVMNQRDRAEAAFVEAWRRGSIEAEERLKEMYREKRGGLQGYDEYLLAKGRGDRNISESWNLPAPQFKATSIDGRSFDLRSLQGRIVVLNMWFIGCGPCRKEIPRLNEIVREFRNREIVFLAPTPDKTEELRPFLKSAPFEYDIVPDADGLLDLFNIATFPTHIVIDRNGQVVALMTGAAERRPEEVRRVLLRLLGAQDPR
ncbi:MAG: TlpA disulfide reductase family protein [Blastocatellia bacterium]|nr:TlpA disulfide reductase family protein [Blastocatellia bacterium]